MEELKRREQNRDKAAIVCPDCWWKHQPQANVSGGLLTCEMCGRMFAYECVEWKEHVTTGLGTCPKCNVILEPTRGGLVPRTHCLSDGHRCKGVGLPAVRQPSNT